MPRCRWKEGWEERVETWGGGSKGRWSVLLWWLTYWWRRSQRWPDNNCWSGGPANLICRFSWYFPSRSILPLIGCCSRPWSRDSRCRGWGRCRGRGRCWPRLLGGTADCRGPELVLSFAEQSFVKDSSAVVDGSHVHPHVCESQSQLRIVRHFSPVGYSHTLSALRVRVKSYIRII